MPFFTQGPRESPSVQAQGPDALAPPPWASSMRTGHGWVTFFICLFVFLVLLGFFVLILDHKKEFKIGIKSLFERVRNILYKNANTINIILMVFLFVILFNIISILYYAVSFLYRYCNDLYIYEEYYYSAIRKHFIFGIVCLFFIGVLLLLSQIKGSMQKKIEGTLTDKGEE